MPGPSRLLIVGASLAANRLLRTLRRKGWDGAAVLVGQEPHLPYDRPPLSKQFLAGSADRDALDLGPADLYDGIELHLGQAATRLDPGQRRVELSDGTAVEADDIVIATGTSARRLPDQPHLDGVVTLRTVEDATALRAALDTAERIVVIGAGFIGSEVASTARSRGVEVTVLEADVAPVVRGVGPVVGNALARLHAEAGVDLRLDTKVAGISGDGSRVTGVKLADGTEVPADVVVVGIGAVPNTDWLDGSGLTIDNGVVTDDRCRAEGGGGHVWAVGDVARWPSARYGRLVRVEHWTNAMDHAVTVTSNLLGGDEVYDPVPYVWSDQFGHKLQTLGLISGDDDVEVVAGDLDADTWVAAYLRDGRLTGIVGLDQPRTVMRARPLVEQGADLDAVRAHVAGDT
jgi:3-phenylpropionate/trans-cinnamate dioxygenase ferredoxin reductase component